MTISQHAPAHRSGFLTTVADGLGRFVRAALVTYRNRQAIQGLTHLSDAALDDMGLTRADVNRALSLPLTDDPSAHLSLLVRRRRGVDQPVHHPR